MRILLGTVVGMLGGLVVATMGAWKDCLYEKFELRKFFRSPLIGAIAGTTIYIIYPHLPLVPLFGTSIAFERLIVELWKSCLRKQPGKFKRENRDNNWLLERLAQVTRIWR